MSTPEPASDQAPIPSPGTPRGGLIGFLQRLKPSPEKPMPEAITPPPADGAAGAAAEAAGLDPERRDAATATALAVGALAAFSALKSEKAEAFDVAAAVSYLVTNLMTPVIQGAVEKGSGAVTGAMGDSSQKIATAVGVTADAIREQMRQQHNERIKHDLRPPPNPCIEAGVSSVCGATSRAAEGRRRYYVNQRLQGRAQQRNTVALDGLDVAEHDRSFPNNEDVDAAVFLKNAGYTEQEAKAARHFIKWVVRGGADRMPSREGRPQAAGSGPLSSEELAYRARWLAENARASAAEDALESVYARREAHPQALENVREALERDKDAKSHVSNWLQQRVGNRRGLSQLDVLELEIARTYENPQWREQMNAEVSPNVMLRALCHQAAFSNKLLFEQLMVAERQMVNLALMATRPKSGM